jgi:hypothetical protein
MGSQKGREFIKCKPDIDAELHLFLQNYKKKGKFRVVFFGNLQFLVIMQIRCNMEISGFLRFPPPIKLTATI